MDLNNKVASLTEINRLYGGYWSFDVTDFRYMINPYFPTEEMMGRLAAGTSVLLKNYPSNNSHISSILAGCLGLDPDKIVIANGTSELIDLICRLYIRKFAIPVPTFNEYISRMEIRDRSYSLFQLQKAAGFKLNLDDYLDFARREGADAVLLVRPSNPDGNLIPLSEIISVMDRLSEFELVLVDESFIDFCGFDAGISMSAYLDRLPNLIIIKSLGKSFGIPGLRLGYGACGNPDIVKTLRRELPIWNVNSFAQYFIEILKDYMSEYKESCRKTMIVARKLFDCLSCLECLRPYLSSCNFMLCEITGNAGASDLAKYLFDNHRILIGDCSAKVGLNDRFVRIAARTKAENERLIEAVKEWQVTLK